MKSNMTHSFREAVRVEDVSIGCAELPGICKHYVVQRACRERFSVISCYHMNSKQLRSSLRTHCLEG